MKQRILIGCASMIVVLVVSPVVFGDILTVGDTLPRTSGPALYVSGDWYSSTAGVLGTDPIL